MPVSIKVSVDGKSEVQRRLRKYANGIEPGQREVIHQAVGVELHSFVMNVFDKEGAHGKGKAWAPLKLGGRYVNGRFTTVYQLLQDTGALRQSYTPLFSPNEMGVGAVSGAKHADLAPLHQFGNEKRNLPARPMLPDDTEALEIATRVYEYFISEAASP